LADGGAHGQRRVEVFLRLDPLGQYERTRALGLGVDGTGYGRDRPVRLLLDETEVQLDHVRSHEWHQRQ
jgi:hypothetical protein